jgi:hypothetical protein
LKDEFLLISGAFSGLVAGGEMASIDEVMSHRNRDPKWMTDSIQTEEVLSSFVGFGVCLLAVRLCFRCCVFCCEQEEKMYYSWGFVDVR